MTSTRNSAATTPNPVRTLLRNSNAVTAIEFGGMGVGVLRMTTGVAVGVGVGWRVVSGSIAGVLVSTAV
jgi:hypothetical protein